MSELTGTELTGAQSTFDGVTFGERLLSVFAERGRLCLGIDPHAGLLRDWGLTDDATGAREFGLRAVDAAAGRIGIVKPQIGFFERHGSAGYAALEEILAAARAAGILVIADVKRGDIGSTMDGYAEAWLTPGSPLEADAITVNSYQGVGSLQGTIDRALAAGKGIFALAATSNPEARATQSAVISSGPRRNSTVAAGVIADVAAFAKGTELGSVGVVIGATVRLVDFGIRPSSLAKVPILAPGFGEQGARFADAASIFGPASRTAILSSSRAILSAGPDGLVAAIDGTLKETMA